MTEYTAWHIARLRDRLARYRAVETLNGRSRSWSMVARDILDTEAIRTAIGSPKEHSLSWRKRCGALWTRNKSPRSNGST